MPELPARRYFTAKQLAQYWNKPQDDIEHYLAEFGLRRAFRLSKEKLSINESEVGSDKIRVQFVENSQKYAQEWLYICDGEETPRNKAALLIGLEPGYFNSDLEVWVGDPVTRVTVEGFDHEKLEVVNQDTSTLLELELGELELVVTLEEANRFEEKWLQPSTADDDLLGREKDGLQRVIALLAVELSKKDRRYMHGEPPDQKPNFKGIGDLIHKNLPNGEKSPAADTIRRKISEAYGSLFSN